MFRAVASRKFMNVSVMFPSSTDQDPKDMKFFETSTWTIRIEVQSAGCFLKDVCPELSVPPCLN